jgi:hypothetical protein
MEPAKPEVGGEGDDPGQQDQGGRSRVESPRAPTAIAPKAATAPRVKPPSKAPRRNQVTVAQ